MTERRIFFYFGVQSDIRPAGRNINSARRVKSIKYIRSGEADPLTAVITFKIRTRPTQSSGCGTRGITDHQTAHDVHGLLRSGCSHADAFIYGVNI